MRLPTAIRSIVVALAAGVSTLTGCSALPTSTPPGVLPEEHLVKLDQLMIHSNFELPSHHRLLEELNAQRTDVSNKLALPVSDEPVHVYLFQTEERFHDFISVNYPQFPTRRAFFVETDTKLKVFAHWGDRMAEDLRHEVAHGYLHSTIPTIPLWIDEGLAEYFEVPRGERGINLPHIIELTALQEAGRWQPDLVRLEELKSPSVMTQVDYAEAWAWTHLLLETTPNRRELLQGYLNTMRRNGTAEPLSLWVRTVQVEPQRTLVEHLKELKAKYQSVITQ